MSRCSVLLLIVAVCLASLTSLTSDGGPRARAERSGSRCVLAPGELTVDDLPAGSSATRCGAVGRLVTHAGAGIAVPEPGTRVSVDSLTADGPGHGFSVTVAADGTVSYAYDDDTRPKARKRDDAPARCADATYATADRKAYGPYRWFIGGGRQPGDLPRHQVRLAFEEAIATIIGGRNACGYDDRIKARARFVSATGHRAGIDREAHCTARDGMSVWDAGDLSSDAVATTCSWSRPVPGGPDRLLEADVRFNTHDFTFTGNPAAGCNRAYDIRSVATHEAGHVFGLAHAGAGHENLTMYANSFACSTTARTLGKGDVLGLRSLY